MPTMRIIWSATGVVVAVCVALLSIRGCRAALPQTRPPSESGVNTNTQRMFALLAADPQARRPLTRKAVETVARRAADPSAAPSAEAYYALGLLRHGQGDYVRSEAAYRKAIETNPGWSWPYNGLGIVLFEIRRIGEAEEMFHTASAITPEWSRPHNDLAVLLRLAGRLDEAEQEALTALKLDPNDVATHNNYGNLLAARTKLTDAEREYRKAIELDPEHPSPHYNLACISARLGRRDEALQHLKKTLEIEPGFTDQARRDPDLAPLADDPVFQLLVGTGIQTGAP